MTDEELERLKNKWLAKDVQKLLTDVRRGVNGASSWLNSDEPNKATQAGVSLICSLRNVLMSPALRKSWERIEEQHKSHPYAYAKYDKLDAFRLVAPREEKA